MRRTTFDTDQFLADCQEAAGEGDGRQAIADLLRRAMAQPGAVGEAFRPTEGGLEILLSSPTLTVAHVVWAPRMSLLPHDHRMWATIGVYAGREDNAFFRRSGPERRRITASGGTTIDTGDVVVLGDDTVHAVSNPATHLTGAIHVYGGDFLNQARSQWASEDAEERPWTKADTDRQFAEANAAWRSGSGS